MYKVATIIFENIFVMVLCKNITYNLVIGDMRSVGPKMLIKHPILTIDHLIQAVKKD
ncbi:nitrous oxide-stimulated promoter family protein [Clostridium homopropionicum]|uniref:nitrous oxide-stimulated promoter family protein n=1 Tax=Clostridium homopropionicum TaxID=36844 RepID=UPI000A9A8A9A|nr:nitrous oxide-stimulated promoter family protein [Clostridium homopropionicum]